MFLKKETVIRCDFRFGIGIVIVIFIWIWGIKHSTKYFYGQAKKIKQSEKIHIYTQAKKIWELSKKYPFYEKIFFFFFSSNVIFTGNNDALFLDISVKEEEEEGRDDRDEGHASTPPEHNVEARAEPGVDVGGKEEVEHRANAADSEGGSEGSGEVIVLEVSVGDGVLGNADATKASAEHNYTNKNVLKGMFLL